VEQPGPNLPVSTTDAYGQPVTQAPGQ